MTVREDSSFSVGGMQEAQTMGIHTGIWLEHCHCNLGISLPLDCLMMSLFLCLLSMSASLGASDVCKFASVGPTY